MVAHLEELDCAGSEGSLDDGKIISLRMSIIRKKQEDVLVAFCTRILDSMNTWGVENLDPEHFDRPVAALLER